MDFITAYYLHKKYSNMTAMAMVKDVNSTPKGGSYKYITISEDGSLLEHDPSECCFTEKKIWDTDIKSEPFFVICKNVDAYIVMRVELSDTKFAHDMFDVKVIDEEDGKFGVCASIDGKDWETLHLPVDLNWERTTLELIDSAVDQFKHISDILSERGLELDIKRDKFSNVHTLYIHSPKWDKHPWAETRNIPIAPLPEDRKTNR